MLDFLWRTLGEIFILKDSKLHSWRTEASGHPSDEHRGTQHGNMGVMHAQIRFQCANYAIHIARFQTQGQHRQEQQHADSKKSPHRAPPVAGFVLGRTSTRGTPKSPPTFSRSLGSRGPSMCTIVSSLGSAAMITNPRMRSLLSDLK